MSHFSYIKTRLLNLEYLRKALDELNVEYQVIETKDLNEISHSNLVISQENGYDVYFKWDGSEYELVTDLSFWQQIWSIDTFITKVSQTYANQTILIESSKQGFEFIEKMKNIDGSTTLILERWK
jgi:hypothetical protein|tara:strand:+ start:1082 stop:1456 length:375 start_codon:yes stop_codon:yes gene_type:complete